MNNYASRVSPIVLAFSGGLDTSFLVPYLKEKEKRPIICATINTGSFSAEQAEALKKRALALGADEFVFIDAKEAYVSQVLSYLIKGNVRRGRVYPLCVGAERIIQAQELVKLATEKKAYAVAHGCTGAGNDQIRFHIYFQILAPSLKVLAPVRDEAFLREDEIAFLEARGLSVEAQKRQVSMNEGLWGKTFGSRELQNTSVPVSSKIYTQSGHNELPHESLELGFEQGLPVSINGSRMALADLIEMLSTLGAKFNVGRGIHVGNTVLGIKGRIAFEAPAAAILLEAHQELEKLVLTKWQTFWKDQLATFYGDQLHEGQWFDPSMRAIEAFMDETQKHVTGCVHLTLREERVEITRLDSPYSLLAQDSAVYGEETHLWSGPDAKGFAQIQSIPGLLYHQVEHIKEKSL